MKNTIIIIILTIALITDMRAQDSTVVGHQHLLGFFSGVSTHVERDEILSPLLYSGSQLPIVLSYKYRGPKSREMFTASYETFQLSSSITNTSTSSHYVNDTKGLFEYWYCRKAITIPTIQTICYLGGNISGFMNWRDFNYLKGSMTTSIESMIGLGFDALFETTFNESSTNFLSIHFHTPLLSYMLLSQRYNVKVNNLKDDLELDDNMYWWALKQGDLVTLNTLFEVRTEVSYTFFIDNTFAVEVQYRFQYYSFDQYKNLFHVRYLNNQFLAGLIIQL
jgi:hypothetical protein